MQNEIQKVIDILRKGGTILYPTDTIWGIGCDATNEAAVEKIYKLKLRAENKSMIILVDSFERLSEYIKDVPDIAADLITGVDSPLTIIYPGAKNLPKNVIASDDTIAIRIVRHEFTTALIEKFGKPIVSTSANISGDHPPKAFREIARPILDGVDYIVNLYQDEVPVMKPSRIIKLSQNGEFRIIRK